MRKTIILLTLALLPLSTFCQSFEGPDDITPLKKPYWRDRDGDGYGNNTESVLAHNRPLGYSINNLDCDDYNKDINPNVLEVADGIDNNCDGQIDEFEFNGEEAEEKYWNYRDRFNKWFVVIGDRQGESIPGHRVFYEDRLLKTNPKINFGDGGIDLGWYIGLLATELKLLRDSDMPYEQTKRELYYALKAYERIDLAAEGHNCINYPFANLSPNGFFIRDDVDRILFDNNPEFGSLYPSSDGRPYNFGSDYKHNSCVNGDGDNRLRFFLSPDQVASLFLGFALTKKCVPSHIHYNGQSLSDLAILNAQRIADYYKKNDWKGKSPAASSTIDFENSFREEHEVVGFAEAADWMVGGDGYKTDLKNELGAIGFSWSANLWRKRFNLKEDALPLAQLAFRHLWNKNDDFAIAHNMIFGAIASNLGFRNNDAKTRERLAQVGIEYHLEVYPLLNSVLHSTGLKSSSTILGNIERELTSAPSSGAHFYRDQRPNNQGVRGWRASNRWIRSKQALTGHDFNADFHGMDYMVAHNLYLIYKRLKYKGRDIEVVGSRSVCGSGSGTYRVKGAPSGSGVTWTTSSNLKIDGSNNGLLVNVSRKNSTKPVGGSWVRANISTSAGVIPISKGLVSEKPVFYVKRTKKRFSYDLSLAAYTHQTSLSEQDITYAKWEKVSSQGSVHLQTSLDKYNAAVAGSRDEWSMRIKVTVTNLCGSSVQYADFYHEGESGSSGPSGPLRIGTEANDTNQYQVHLVSKELYKLSGLESPHKVINAVLLDYNGKKIRKFSSNHFNVNNLAKGVYILKVELAEAFIIERVLVD